MGGCRICAALAAFVVLLPVPSALAATVTGAVRLLDSRESAVRNKHDFSGVVIWLERTDGDVIPITPKTAQMVQRKKTFFPHILAVPLGSTILFPNLDPIFHNVFSNFDGQIFDVGLYPPGNDQKVRFIRPGIVRVFCNIHPTMFAVIVVLKTPYIAVSNADGSFRFDGVRAGEYRLQVFHERATQEVLKALQGTAMVDSESLSLGLRDISETSYIADPHKNKFGKDYPAVIEDRPMYPAARAR
jgi:plastocyanin